MIVEEQEVRRGEIYHADLNPVFGSEQGGYRPVLIIQNNRGNRHTNLSCFQDFLFKSVYIRKGRNISDYFSIITKIFDVANYVIRISHLVYLNKKDPVQICTEPCVNTNSVLCGTIIAAFAALDAHERRN